MNNPSYIDSLSVSCARPSAALDFWKYPFRSSTKNSDPAAAQVIYPSACSARNVPLVPPSHPSRISGKTGSGAPSPKTYVLLKIAATVHPTHAAKIVVHTYSPIVNPTILPASPSASISITLIAMDTKTSGSTIHFNARIKTSPNKPIHCIVTAFAPVLSSHCDRPIPKHRPITAPAMTKLTGYFSIKA